MSAPRDEAKSAGPCGITYSGSGNVCRGSRIERIVGGRRAVAHLEAQCREALVAQGVDLGGAQVGFVETVLSVPAEPSGFFEEDKLAFIMKRPPSPYDHKAGCACLTEWGPS